MMSHSSGVSLPGLRRDLARDPFLADVVQQSGDRDFVQIRRLEGEVLCQRQGQQGDVERVGEGIFVVLHERVHGEQRACFLHRHRCQVGRRLVELFDVVDLPRLPCHRLDAAHDLQPRAVRLPGTEQAVGIPNISRIDSDRADLDVRKIDLLDLCLQAARRCQLLGAVAEDREQGEHLVALDTGLEYELLDAQLREHRCELGDHFARYVDLMVTENELAIGVGNAKRLVASQHGAQIGVQLVDGLGEPRVLGRIDLLTLEGRLYQSGQFLQLFTRGDA